MPLSRKREKTVCSARSMALNPTTAMWLICSGKVA
ncbi:hypothetical protein EVA_16928 [gut metagenome]|uniref:Uncharacterized protein n=1 Tax=gut metagenome TaxID=749906 RepID=J9G639_9ZZZZ